MKINRNDSASVSLLCSHGSRAQSLGSKSWCWMFPAWRALVEACFSHLCDCASAFLICPQVPSSSHHEQAPSSEFQPTHLDPWNSDLFCFKSLPPGAWLCSLSLSHWLGMWSANIQNTYNHKATHLAQSLALLRNSCCCIRSFRTLGYYNAAPREGRWELFK